MSKKEDVENTLEEVKQDWIDEINVVYNNYKASEIAYNDCAKILLSVAEDADGTANLSDSHILISSLISELKTKVKLGFSRAITVEEQASLDEIDTKYYNLVKEKAELF